ncbi:cache domain-containing sensor histidine kinase [Cohnella cellulosilytica]|uniref:Sensor histidine kinase n=1 Tax=Cohnella cellulosilytica TaxID=986710 RepID=A0ABW2F858_9BACL
MGKSLMNPLTRLSVKQQLVLLFIVLVSPVFVIHWYGNFKAEQILKRHVTQAYSELNKQNRLLISRDLDTVNRVTRAIIQDPLTQAMNTNRPATLLDRLTNYDEMEKLLGSYSGGINGGEAIHYTLYVYDPGGEYSVAPKTPNQTKNSGVFFYSDDSKTDWIKEAEARKGAGYLRMLSRDGSPEWSKQTLYYIRAINNIYRANDVIGVLIATMDRKIGQSLQTISLSDGEIYLTDWSNRILAATVPVQDAYFRLPEEIHTGASYEGTLDAISSDFIYVMSYSYRADQKLIYRVPVHTLLRQQNELKRVIQFITVADALLAVLVMSYFWQGLMTPLQRLAWFVRHYVPGRLVPNTPDRYRKDEVGVLVSSVYDMARRLNVLIRDHYTDEIKRKETQLHLLYQQINPHLLYNTLETIYWKSMLEGKSESAEMIKELSKLMKIALSRGKELIPLEEELQHATAYTALVEKRQEQRFHIRWNVDQDVLACAIPKITLQPLIENAIIHGVKNMGEDGEIAVNGRRDGDRIVIDIEDNGYKEIDVEALTNHLNEERGEADKGYGIRNVHQRIQLHFGAAYGLSYSKRPGGGTIATVTIPCGRHEQTESTSSEVSHVQHPNRR